MMSSFAVPLNEKKNDQGTQRLFLGTEFEFQMPALGQVAIHYIPLNEIFK